MATVQIAKEALDVALMLGGCFMVGLFKFGVTNKGFTMLAPVFGLPRRSVYWCGGGMLVRTVDFQYSDMG